MPRTKQSPQESPAAAAASNGQAIPRQCDAAGLVSFFTNIDRSSLDAAIKLKEEELRRVQGELSGLRSVQKSLNWRDGTRRPYRRNAKATAEPTTQSADAEENDSEENDLDEAIYDYLLSCPKGDASAAQIGLALHAKPAAVEAVLRADPRFSVRGMNWRLDEE